MRKLKKTIPAMLLLAFAQHGLADDDSKHVLAKQNATIVQMKTELDKLRKALQGLQGAQLIHSCRVVQSAQIEMEPGFFSHGQAFCGNDEIVMSGGYESASWKATPACYPYGSYVYGQSWVVDFAGELDACKGHTWKLKVTCCKVAKLPAF